MKNRIRSLRRARGLTLRELGTVLGLAESTVSQYETGRREPGSEVLLRLADYFGVTVGYLLGAEEAPGKLGFDDFEYALLSEARDLPEERRRMLLEMARFMKADLEQDQR